MTRGRSLGKTFHTACLLVAVSVAQGSCGYILVVSSVCEGVNN